MQDKKVKSTKGKIIFASLLIAISMIGELYGWITFNNGIVTYVLLAGCAVILIVSICMLVSSIYAVQEFKTKQLREQIESVVKSEKAAYLLMKKNFEQMEEQMNSFQNDSGVPAEDIINAQKGVAKVIINRNKENADALMNSNDELMEQIASFEEILKNNNDAIIENQKELFAAREDDSKENNQSDNGDYKEFLLKQQEFMSALKDMEIRLNQAIMQTQQSIASQPVQLTARVDIPPQQIAMPFMQAPMMQAAPMPAQPIVPQQIPAPEQTQIEQAPAIENVAIENPVIEEAPMMDMPVEDFGVDSLSEEVSGIEETISSEDIAEDFEPAIEDIAIDGTSEEDIALEAIENIEDITEIEEINTEESSEDESAGEELPPMPDLSDPNKALNADEISALFANMGIDEEAAEAEAETVVEEKPPMPDLSDPNKALNADEIAALFANMGGDSEPEPEPVVEEEPVIEEPAIEEPVVEEVVVESAPEPEKPPMPDLSDPNKQLSADEIAALFANMGVDNDPTPEPEPEPEPAPAPALDLSDPNKKLSPDEIAALIASM